MVLIRKQARSTALQAVRIAQDHKAIDLRILQVSKHCDYADFLILLSATSQRHARALADALEEKGLNGSKRSEGYSVGEWILIDLDDVVVHIFHEPTRAYYNFDKLWAHAPETTKQKLTRTKKPRASRSGTR